MGNAFKKGESIEARYTKPTGLYPTCAWDERVVRRMILDRHLAPRFPGTEDPGEATEECPICFLVCVRGLGRGGGGAAGGLGRRACRAGDVAGSEVAGSDFFDSDSEYASNVSSLLLGTG